MGIVLPSKLGFVFLKDAPLNAGLSILDAEQSSLDETWTQPWGEVKTIRDHHNELRIQFSDGVGFRYEFPEQPNLDEFEIMDEQTEFALSGDHQAWWIGAFQSNRYEYLYNDTPLSKR